MKSCAYRAALALLIGACAGCDIGVPSRDTAVNTNTTIAPPKQGRAKASLTVVIERTDKMPVLVVTLENTGPVPLVVDRELVFGLHVEVTTEDGQYIWPVFPHTADSTLPQQRSLLRRFTTLGLGESVVRRIDLFGGLKYFEVATGYGPNGEHSFSAYEGVECVPTDQQAHFVTVTYGTQFDLDIGLRSYVGKGVKEIGLYEGPLESTVELDEVLWQ